MNGLTITNSQIALSKNDIKTIIPTTKSLQEIMCNLPPPYLSGSDILKQFVEMSEPNLNYTPFNYEAPRKSVCSGFITFVKYNDNGQLIWIYLGPVKL